MVTGFGNQAHKNDDLVTGTILLPPVHPTKGETK